MVLGYAYRSSRFYGKELSAVPAITRRILHVTQHNTTLAAYILPELLSAVCPQLLTKYLPRILDEHMANDRLRT
jgi:hypothetical protein